MYLFRRGSDFVSLLPFSHNTCISHSLEFSPSSVARSEKYLYDQTVRPSAYIDQSPLIFQCTQKCFMLLLSILLLHSKDLLIKRLIPSLFLQSDRPRPQEKLMCSFYQNSMHSGTIQSHYLLQGRIQMIWLLVSLHVEIRIIQNSIHFSLMLNLECPLVLSPHGKLVFAM